MERKRFINKVLIGGGIFLFTNSCLFAQETTNTETQPKVVNVSETPPTEDTSKKMTTLGEVVINTALGFKRTAKSLAYSAQEIRPDELTTVKDANFTNAITGKASNVTITQGSGGAGSATNIILRGNNSFSGSGQPLIVIDGIPTVNYNQRPTTGVAQEGSNYLAPDGLSTINSDDVESLTILKGPAAAALYGSQAANGAILITTKSGKEGRATINVSSNTTFSTPMYTPKLQTEYGADPLGQLGSQSWGPKTPDAIYAKNFYKDILQTGVNTVNAVNFSMGNKMGQIFTSYANTYGKGLLPNNTLNRHNFDLKGDANFFNKFLEVGAKVSYMQQVLNNPYSPGTGLNPYYTLMTLSANTPLNDYSDYTTNNGQTWYNGQNWVNNPNQVGDNPYWLLNKVRTTDHLSRILASANIKLNFTEWLNLMARGTLDKTNQRLITKMYQGTNTTMAGVNGSYADRGTEIIQYYGDVILNFNKDVIKDIFHINAFVGGAIRDYTLTGTHIGSGRTTLVVPNVFSVANINFTPGNGSFVTPDYLRRQVQSVFYSLELSYKNALFLTTTGRNDWSSTLPTNANSYFYPSVGASAVLTELIQGMQSKTLNYLKVRLDYTQVGNDLAQMTIVNPVLGLSASGTTVPDAIIKPGVTIKPELTESIEAGLDFALFNNLLKFEGTYYKTNTTNQLFRVSAPRSSGYKEFYINGGDIQNQGVELSLSVSPKFGHVEWTSTINFSKNINKIIRLTEEVQEYIYSQLNNSNSYLQKIKVGGSLGDLYAKKWVRNPDGSIKVDYPYINGVPDLNNPIPVAQANAEKIGSAYPDFLLSWGNSFTYKGFRLSFLIDGRFGGKVISLTQAALDGSGNSIASANDRNNESVNIGGGQTLGASIADVRSFYTTQAGIAGPLGEYAYDATVIRLRELSLSYSFRTLLEKTKAFKYIKNISVSFIARNLFYFYKPAPIDPEIVSNNGQGRFSYLGLEMYNLPATRSFGFGVNFTF